MSSTSSASLPSHGFVDADGHSNRRVGMSQGERPIPPPESALNAFLGRTASRVS